MSSNVCSSCGEASLVWDGYGEQGENNTLQVCSACGAVSEEGVSTLSEIQGGTGFCNSQEFRSYARSLPTQYVQFNHTSAAKGKLLGIQKTKEVASIMGLTKAMTLEATSMFEKVYYHDSINHKHINQKLTIAGCCVYIVCRQHGWPVLMKCVAEMVNCHKSQIVHWKNVVTALLCITLSSVDAEELIPEICHAADFSKTVESLMGSIIWLCQKAWIAEGRDPSTIVNVASYLAWQAEEPLARRKTSLKKFCANCHVLFRNNYCLRLAEMRRMLCELAEQIPWVNADEVTTSNVAMYIKDVCTFQKQLLSSALAKMLADNELSVGGCDLNEAGCIDSGATPVVSVTDHVDSLRETAATPKANTVVVINKPVSGVSTTILPSVTYDANQCTSIDLQRKLGKRKKGSGLIAASFKRARESDMSRVSVPRNDDKTVDRDLDCEEITEEDIPNSEMSMYIKTEEEIRQVNVIKSMARKFPAS